MAGRGVASPGRSSASLRALPREGMTTDRLSYAAETGGMFKLARKRLSGSQVALTSVRRR